MYPNNKVPWIISQLIECSRRLFEIRRDLKFNIGALRRPLASKFQNIFSPCIVYSETWSTSRNTSKSKPRRHIHDKSIKMGSEKMFHLMKSFHQMSDTSITSEKPRLTSCNLHSILLAFKRPCCLVIDFVSLSVGPRWSLIKFTKCDQSHEKNEQRQQRRKDCKNLVKISHAAKKISFWCKRWANKSITSVWWR